MGADPLGRGKEWVWRPFTPVGVLNDAAAAVNAATPAEVEALIKELDKIDP
ncbi:hypothetical protein [Corynebacterium diphtheriae]|uniref:hypothetical protein n=1 Tax=Corynebacterium diphtheriae TaxID=1717 RepID=UPI0018C94B2D|nr:hypothetical protein [Corynebacterium diphtheriae]MBG9294437.1 hypothetical protein [Corynebacterium diphtheriae bv. mitis]